MSDIGNNSSTFKGHAPSFEMEQNLELTNYFSELANFCLPNSFHPEELLNDHDPFQIHSNAVQSSPEILQRHDLGVASSVLTDGLISKEWDVCSSSKFALSSTGDVSQNLLHFASFTSENTISSYKRKREEDRGTKKLSKMVHVRAKRGQATDSHSVAERARRGKINERLKSLQEMVPGCCKSMGMTVMLDEIINYVQSLKHQIEFLSMKLNAASSFYDFNAESDSINAMQWEQASNIKRRGDRHPEVSELFSWAWRI